MLNICHSNSIEVLLLKLAQQLASSPLGSVFTPETIITPSPAMARWNNIELAKHQGIAANIDYPLPSSFIWRVARNILTDIPEKDPLGITAMSWKGFKLLPELLDNPEFIQLKQYLANDVNSIKRWQLSAKIADTFDRYQLYRPDLIRKWGRGEEDDWQAILWRKLLSTVSHHRVANIDRLQEYLYKNKEIKLPERISFFAISTLPPYFIDIIHALSRHTQFDLYLHSPTPEFWADLKSQKALAKKRIAQPDEAALWEVGNDILASWGRQGQGLQDLLLQGENPVNETDAFIEPQRTTLLSCLQNDIYTLQSENRISPSMDAEQDDSLQIHVCHSPQRECQVLHDQLLQLFEQYPDLNSEDVLVMIPEINLYAPYIESVFHRDEAGAKPYIPWNLSDISISDQHPVIQVFLQLLNLPQSRFTQSEISSYLDVPEIAERFNLDSTSIEKIKQWLVETNLRWGVDAEHKEKMGLPGYIENTLQQTEERLFSAYALEPMDLYQGMAPVQRMEGSEAEILGSFWHIIETLKKYRKSLAVKRTPQQWQDFLFVLLNEFFVDTDEDDQRIQKIRDAIADLAEQGTDLDEPVSNGLVRYWLNQQLNTQTRRGRYFTGGVTFCGMRPMRSVPFKVICLLGMHDQAFPRRENMTEFDLMAVSNRVGDPRKGEEDRYLFLQTLLCARQTLYISYIGRDIRTNQTRQPSVLVTELLDYIDSPHDKNTQKLKQSEKLTSIHPLQAFSRQNYSGSQASFDNYWCKLANSINEDKEIIADAGWNKSGLARLDTSTDIQAISISSLLSFVRHPIKFFINSRLKIYLADESISDDDEHFNPDNLHAYLLAQRILTSDMAHDSVTVQKLKAEGQLPHGIFASHWFENCNNIAQPIKSSLQEYIAQSPDKKLIQFDVELGSDDTVCLQGELANIYSGQTLLRYKASKLKGVDILALWIEHLIWCAADEKPDGIPEENNEKKSILFCRDKFLRFNESVASEMAKQYLSSYMGWYKKSKLRPILLLPLASYAYATALLDKSGKLDPDADIEKALQKAMSAWHGNSFTNAPSDKDDEYIQIVMRGMDIEPVLNPEFQSLASEFYLTALEQSEIHELY